MGKRRTVTVDAQRVVPGRLADPGAFDGQTVGVRLYRHQVEDSEGKGRGAMLGPCTL